MAYTDREHEARKDTVLPLYSTNSNSGVSAHDQEATAKSRSHTPLRSAPMHKLSPLTNTRSHPARDGSSQDVSPLHQNSLPSQNTALPRADRPQFAILVVLYLIQGVPIGLAFGSIPFLLKSSNLSYSQVGIFSLASYPYSFKLVYSPIVDSVFSRRIGRRKSWILPVQFVSGITLIALSARVDALMADISHTLPTLTFLFFLLILLCATQDIAVDGWALTILSPQALSYASTAQTIGLNCGYFLSFTVFLAFSSPEFANKYFRAAPQDTGLVSLPQYLRICGVLFMVVTVIVAIFVPEHPRHFALDNKRSDDIEMTTGPPFESAVDEHPTELDHESAWENLKSVYAKMYRVVKLPNVKVFILLHLISKIGFQTNEAATNLKLLEKGFAKEDLAITVLIDFPFEIIFGYYAGRWSTGDEPLRPWLYAFLGRIVAAACGQVLVWSFPRDAEIGTTYFVAVILQHLLGSFMSTVQFVSICAFHTKIADPLIGGTYMTTLNTLSNLGGQWPKIIVLYLIDNFTVAHCTGPDAQPELFAVEPFYQCSKGDARAQCIAAGGLCVTQRDGYYYTNFLCIAVGLATYFLWIRKTAKHLQSLPQQSWRVRN